MKIGSKDISAIYKGGTSVSKIYRGSELVWPLSQEDILLEWISNGSDSSLTPDVWFDLGFVYTHNTRIEVKYSQDDVSTSPQCLAGASSGSSQYTQLLSDGNKIRMQFSNGMTANSKHQAQSGQPLIASSYGDDLLSRQILVVTDQGMQYSGDVITYLTSLVDVTMGLFARHNYNDTANVYCKGGCKVYYVSVWESDVLTHNYIPVLHNGVPCLYDTVTEEYIYNQGNDTPGYSQAGQ